MDFSTAIQQMVAIARAVSFKARLVIMDEPTSSLDEREVAVLFDVMRQLRAEGVAVIFITHRLDELYQVCDRVTVMRDGRTVMTSRMARRRQAPSHRGHARARPRDRPRARDRLFHDRRGKAGDEVLSRRRASNRPQGARRARRGAEPARSSAWRACSARGEPKWRGRFSAPIRRTPGRIRLMGKDVAPREPSDAIALGVGYCSEDRKADGIIPDMSVRENITLAHPAAPGEIGHRRRSAPARDRRPVHGASRRSRPRASSRRSASFPAAISRRCCSRAGSAPTRSC